MWFKENIRYVRFAYYDWIGLVNTNEQVKILAKGIYSAKLNITAHQCSEAAIKLIQENGGNFNAIEKKNESKS